MDNHNHPLEVLDLVPTSMAQIDGIPCHPTEKLPLYHHFVLSKIARYLTIANLGKTWVVEDIDNLVTSYILQWLELPITATLSTPILPKSKYGINYILPSTKFLPCQIVIWNILKSSPNWKINLLWVKISIGCNIQYDKYKNTKHILTVIHKDDASSKTHELKLQRFVIPCVLTHANSKPRSLWSTVQQSIAKIFSTFQ